MTEQPPPSGSGKSSVVRTAIVTSLLTTLALGLIAVCAGGAIALVVKMQKEPSDRARWERGGTSVAPGEERTGFFTRAEPEARFVVPVTDRTCDLTVRASSPEGPLDAGVRFAGSRAEKEFDAWWSGSPEKVQGGTTVFDDDGMRAGGAIVVVRPHRTLRAGERWPFKCVVKVTELEPPPVVTGDVLDVAGETEPEHGWSGVVALRTATPQERWRIDVVSREYQVDFLVGFGRPALRESEAVASACCAIGAQTVVLGEGGLPAPPKDGVVYVSVIDPRHHKDDLPFRVLVHPGTGPHPAAPPLEQIELPRDPVERGWRSTTLISTEAGAWGSATFVSSGGLLLTAAHVVAACAKPGTSPPKDDIRVLVTRDPRRFPECLYRAHVTDIDFDRDLALLQVGQGALSQPLPAGMTFPFVPVAKSDPPLGAALASLGHPELLAYRKTMVTLSRGPFSGYLDETPRTVAKMHGFAANGGSGGGVYDLAWSLCGVHIRSTQARTGAVMGLFRPVSDFPEEWLERLRAK